MKSVVIPKLEEFPFRGSKFYDYLYIKKAIEIMESKTLSKNEKHEILTELKIKVKKREQRVSPVLIPQVLEDPVGVEALSDKELIEMISDKDLNLNIDPW